MPLPIRRWHPRQAVPFGEGHANQSIPAIFPFGRDTSDGDGGLLARVLGGCKLLAARLNLQVRVGATAACRDVLAVMAAEWCAP